LTNKFKSGTYSWICCPIHLSFIVIQAVANADQHSAGGAIFAGEQTMRRSISSAFAVMTVVIFTGGSALADVFQTYDLAWSGSFLGNSASASGDITLDLTALINPTVPGGLGGTGYYDIFNDISSLTVTVTGAVAGNGTYTLSDLCACSPLSSFTFWSTNGDTANMMGNVLAQLNDDGGDFNLFFASPGPQGEDVLSLTTDAGNGDPMAMTKFAPAPEPAPVPEPAAWVMMGLGFAGLAFARLRARRTATAIA
jgi:hypothetical protein